MGMISLFRDGIGTLIGSGMFWVTDSNVNSEAVRGMGKMNCKSIWILTRIITRCLDRVEYEADQRHAEIIIKQFGLKEGSRGLASPNHKRKIRKNGDQDKQ